MEVEEPVFDVGRDSYFREIEVAVGKAAGKEVDREQVEVESEVRRAVGRYSKTVEEHEGEFAGNVALQEDVDRKQQEPVSPMIDDVSLNGLAVELPAESSSQSHRSFLVPCSARRAVGYQESQRMQDDLPLLNHRVRLGHHL